jgi:hypothetical protein
MMRGHNNPVPPRYLMAAGESIELFNPLRPARVRLAIALLQSLLLFALLLRLALCHLPFV